MKPFLLDTHTHTIASGHAYGTVMEMAKAAGEAGLELLAITDHAPKLPGASTEIYFRNFKAIDRYLYGVELLMGVELNVIDYQGTIDLPESILKHMGICIASMHGLCLKAGSKKENTYSLLKVMENPYVTTIGHPDDGFFLIDYEELVRGAKEAGVLIEVNNCSLRPKASRINARENLIRILKYCEQYEQAVVVNTDAHFPTLVGRFEEARQLFEEMDFPEELIVNTDPEKLKKYLNRGRL